MADESPQSFPKQADKPRLEAYEVFDKIYAGDHFDAFKITGEKDFTKAYSRLRYVVVNFAGLMSRVMADMLFGEKVTIDLESDENQEYVSTLIEQNSLMSQLYESALANSRRGDVVFKLRIGRRNVTDETSKSTIIIEQQSAATYFPEFDARNAINTPAQDVLVWKFHVGGTCYLHKESHRPGFIVTEIWKYDEKAEKVISQETPEEFGFKSIETTKIKKSLVFHIPNVRDGNGFFGTSDYKDLMQLFFAINNRLTKIDNILDKHSDPILAVPEGVLDEDGKINKGFLGMFEVDSESPGFNKPEYIVWNANLESAFTQIEKLLEILFMTSEIAPATMGMDKNSVAESGRALKFKLLATIRKRNRKIRYYDEQIKNMLEVAQELGIAWGIDMDSKRISKPERPKIDWGDGVINDETEMVDNAVKRIDAGLSSRADEIARLDGLTPEEAEAKVKEIDKEAEIAVPAGEGNVNGSFANNGTQPNKEPQKQPAKQGA